MEVVCHRVSFVVVHRLAFNVCFERIDFCQVFFIKVDLTLFCLILLGSFPIVCLSVRRCIHRGGDVMQMSIVRNERKKCFQKFANVGQTIF